MISTTFSASFRPPLDPCSQTVLSMTSTPRWAHFSIVISTSAFVSCEKRFSPTTTGTPKDRQLSICCFRFARPMESASRFSVPSSVLWDTAVHLERSDRRNDDDYVGLEPRLAADDVEELLGAQICPNPASVTT